MRPETASHTRSGAAGDSRRARAEPTFCSGLADLAARYRGFIVDQWGVLHDGGAPYPLALEALAELRAAGRRVVLLSNSGKRAAINRRRLAALGIAPDLYDGLVTSGEATWQALAERGDPVFARLGRRCLLWSRDGDRSLVEDQKLELADDVATADFLLLGGIADDARLEPFTATLEQAAARGLPMVCANPDVIAVQPGGRFGFAPGALARQYETLGGQVAYVGKPFPPVYELCLDALGPLAREEVLVVGDSVAHDVAGGAGMGLATALIMAGIHAPLFDLERGPSANAAALERLEAEYGARPDWVLPRFCWR
jgi:HAD superfamily hydrolase (TIGR01459 family)